MIPGTATFIPNSVVPGSETYSTPGTYTFTVPNYNSITFEVYGGGGGGGFYNLGAVLPGGAGGTSSVNIPQGTFQATGGAGGQINAGSAAGGTGTAPSGGTTATGGTSPSVAFTATGGKGAGPLGGNGGVGINNGSVSQGSPPGGGGGGYGGQTDAGTQRYAAGGGGGGYASYTTFQYVGTTLTVIVGAGGTSSYNSSIIGGAGRVIITWS